MFNALHAVPARLSLGLEHSALPRAALVPPFRRVRSRYLQPSAFDGLAVGVATVPVVLSSALLLCELKSVNTVRESGGSVVEELTVEELDRSDWVEYLGTVLEGSLMCAVWEVSHGDSGRPLGPRCSNNRLDKATEKRKPP